MASVAVVILGLSLVEPRTRFLATIGRRQMSARKTFRHRTTSPGHHAADVEDRVGELLRKHALLNFGSQLSRDQLVQELVGLRIDNGVIHVVMAPVMSVARKPNLNTGRNRRRREATCAHGGYFSIGRHPAQRNQRAHQDANWNGEDEDLRQQQSEKIGQRSGIR